MLMMIGCFIISGFPFYGGLPKLQSPLPLAMTPLMPAQARPDEVLRVAIRVDVLDNFFTITS